MNNIKKLFPEFYQDKIKTGDFDKKEKNIIVLDTNYLLDILQLSTELASQYVEAIENIQELIYIPYLVALEFNFGKSGIKKRKQHNIQKYKQSIENTIVQLREDISNVELLKLKGSESEFSEVVVKQLEKFKSGLTQKIDNQIGQMVTKEEESIYTRLLQVIENRVGEQYTQEWINEVEKEGEERYKNKIPPGFSDVGKSENEVSRKYSGIKYQRKYGDLIIWKDIIKYVKASNSTGKKVIYVTNDGQSLRKKDLLYRVETLTVGPHINLMNELYNESKKELYVLSNIHFIQLVSNLSEDQARQLESTVGEERRFRFKANKNQISEIMEQIARQNKNEGREAIGLDKDNFLWIKKDILNELNERDKKQYEFDNHTLREIYKDEKQRNLKKIIEEKNYQMLKDRILMQEENRNLPDIPFIKVDGEDELWMSEYKKMRKIYLEEE